MLTFQACVFRACDGVCGSKDGNGGVGSGREVAKGFAKA